MWIMKIIIPYLEKSVFGNVCKKNKTSLIGYPISHYTKDDKVCVTISGFMQSNNPKKFI